MTPEAEHRSFSLETRRIRLRGILNEDFETLFSWRNTERFRLLFHHTDKEINYEKFCEEFKRDAAFKKYQYMIEMKDSNESAGYAFIHSNSENDEDCFINIFLSGSFEKKGYGVDVFVLLALLLLNENGIKRFFAEVLSYNKHSVSCLQNSGMTKVIGLNNKIVLAGKEYDLLRFAGDKKLIPKLKRFHKHLSVHKHQLRSLNI